ncbi:ribosomal protein S16 [Pseudovirgaria hyperparasitica]|uniref:Ribosomal protein S16 n=1 Tax=Pseudovirgaria hyperparasitica TaxID=470096 RepID=A0A6A6W807_9PEZI|nr:ribosomal protein S16 [Pseudovirgaria hyperparasitica]KAF2758339.1 ribosomal protein S16 [Pseudovirgaria hyperparasitica]
MVLRIRLARFGKRHAPFYNIVLAQARTARNSLPMEVLGTYDPIPKPPAPGSPPTARKHKDIKLDISRAKYWIGVGAQPSDTCWRILGMAGIMPPRPKVRQRDSLRIQEEEAARAQAEKLVPQGVVGGRIVKPAGFKQRKEA